METKSEAVIKPVLKSGISSFSKNELIFLRMILSCSHDLSESEFDSFSIYMGMLFDNAIIPDQYISIYIDLCFYFSGNYKEKRYTWKDKKELLNACIERSESFYQNFCSNSSYSEMMNSIYCKIYSKDKAAAYAAILAFQNLDFTDNENSSLTFDFQFAIFRNKSQKYKEIFNRAYSILESDLPEDVEMLDKFYGSLSEYLTQYASGCVSFLKEFESQDIWEIINFHLLPEKSTRMGYRQISRSKIAIGPMAASTRATILNVLRNSMSLDPDVEKYPIGGFAEMINNGDIDNLVHSELVYSGENISPTFDLFDLRYNQKEILYYTRDQSISFDPKRYLLISMNNIESLSYKAKDQPFQVKIITIALVSKFIDEFLEIFKRTSSRIDIVCGEQEKNIFQTLYNIEIERGLINFVTEESYEKYSGVLSINKEMGDFITVMPGKTFHFSNENKKESFTYSPYNMRNLLDEMLIGAAKIRNKTFFFALKEAIKGRKVKSTSV